MSNVLGIERSKAVTCIQTSITEEPVPRSVNIIASALCDRVYNSTHGLTIFGRVIIGDDLKLLDGLLRNRAGDSGSPGILVVKGIRGVVPIRQKCVVPANTAETQQPERAIRHHSRRQENKGVYTPPVNRQFQNLS